MSRARSLLPRLALVPLSLLFVLVVAEVGLHVAAFFVQRSALGDRPAAADASGALRVLSLGDSNTYGLWVEREEAYPRQLEALWNATHEEPRLEVFNLGIPGTNSSRIVRDFDRLLDAFQPDLVTVLVGINDFWTLPFAADEAEEAHEGWGERLLRHSRVYRLFRMRRRGLAAPEVEIRELPTVAREDGPEGESVLESGGARVRFGDQEFEMDFRAKPPGVDADFPVEREALERNLERLAQEAERRGAELVLLSYPVHGGHYGWANRGIRAAARDAGVPLIDLTTRFAPICPRLPCPAYLFDDGHPKPRGYHLIAETIADWLEARAGT